MKIEKTLFWTPSLFSLILLLGGAAGCGKAQPDADKAPGAGAAEAAQATGGVPIPTDGAVISGTIQFEGDAPTLGEIDMSEEPVCVNQWEEAGKVPRSEALLLGEGNTVGNVFVSIKSGLSESNYSPSNETVYVNQKGCRYYPHVFALMKGQSLVFKNSDGVLHNVHSLPDKNREFNLSMPATMKESSSRSFRKAEGMFRIKCDVHPWMSSYAAVLTHPFFAVSGSDGRYEIGNLPPGTYEVEAWHEKMGTRTASITVAAKETRTADFTFSR